MVKCRKKFILLQNSKYNSLGKIAGKSDFVLLDFLSISLKKSLYKVNGFLYNSTCGLGL